MPKTVSILVVFVSTLVVNLMGAVVSTADVPRLIHYQGKLRDAGGIAVTDTVSLRLRFYNGPTSTTPVLFDETHPSENITNGLLTVLIGSQTLGGVPDSSLDASTVYLGLSINDGLELSPRTLIGSTGHAIKSRSAEQLVRPGTFDAAVRVDAAGNVGVGTADPSATLDVSGNLRISDGTEGDARILTSDSDGMASWQSPPEGVPSGISVLSESSTPPAGYTYTGASISGGGDAWAMKASMLTARGQMGAATVGTTVYVVGGYIGSELAVVEAYDTVGNTWSTKASLQNARNEPGVVALDGNVYAIGGHNGAIYLASVEQYDPIGDSWTYKASMSAARNAAGAAVVQGKIYAIGGGNGPLLTTVEVYDPVGNSWSPRVAMPTARNGHGVAAVNDTIYAVGGHIGGGAWTGVVEAYDTVGNAWSTKAPLITARYGVAVAALGGKVFAIGGYNGARLATVEEYDPVTDAWITRTSMSVARDAPAAATAGGRIYAIGGYNAGWRNTVEEYRSLSLFYIHRRD